MPLSNKNPPPLYVAVPDPEIPLDNFRNQDEEAQTIAAIISFLIGCAIISGCIYALSQSIQNDIDEKYAWMIQYPREYIDMAKTQAYDVCYSGCEFCESVKYAQRACARTAEVNVPGVVCDANKLRDAEDRYPAACLEAVAEVYKKDLFRKARRDYQAQFAVIILIVPAGLLGWAATYEILKRCFMGCPDSEE